MIINWKRNLSYLYSFFFTVYLTYIIKKLLQLQNCISEVGVYNTNSKMKQVKTIEICFCHHHDYLTKSTYIKEQNTNKL